jgi:hypothetical protein
MQAHGGAGEAALLGNGEKGFKLGKFHNSGQKSEIRDQRSDSL